MSFQFTVREFILGGGTGTPTLQFYKRGFNLGGNGTSPSWQDIILSGNTALTLTNALANGLNYLKLFGGCEQRNLPVGYTQVNYVTNTAPTWLDTGVKFDFSKNYEIELRVRGTSGSWYILQARGDGSAYIYGISGSQNNNTIILGFNGSNISTSQVSRINGNIYYVKGTINNGNLTLYVKDETADTEETVTGTYIVATGESVNIGLFGNLAQQFVGIDSDVYFARIKEDNNYILNYVSCRQGATAGFYDKASNTFKTTTDLVADGNTVPSPDTPMDIVCNNGVVKVSSNLFNATWEQGAISGTPNKTYEEVKIALTNRIRIVNEIYLDYTKTYTISINNPDLEFVIQVFDSQHRLYKITDVSDVWGTSPKTFTGAYGIAIALRHKTQVDILPTEGQNAKVQLELGSVATSYMPYGIYTDGTTETVEVIGKNLVNPGTITNNKYILDRGAEASDNSYVISDYIYVKGASKITISTTDTGSYPFGGSACKAFYDADKNYIDNTATQNMQITSTNPATVTVPSNAVYFRTSIRKLSVRKAQVEYGDTATTYEPYFNGGTATAEMLLRVGTYQDVQSVLDGVVTRNVGFKVLKGADDEFYVKNGNRYYYAPPNVLNEGNIRSTNLLCSHFLNSIAGVEGDCFKYSVQIYFYPNMTLCPDATAFKQWVADQYNSGNPVVIVYPLAEPTTETVTGQPLTTQAGTNIVEITQGSIDGLGLEASYKATV